MARAQRGEPSGLQEAAWPLRVPTFSKKRSACGQPPDAPSYPDEREIPSFSIHSRTHPLNVIISQSLYTGNSVFRFLFLRIDHDTRLTNQSERYTFGQIFSLPFSSNCKIRGKDLYSGNGCSILAIEAVLTHATDFLPSKKIFKTRASISENEAVESDWLGEEGRASGDLQAKCK